jgi:transcription initiation factor IIE alpha subunit
MLARTFYDDVTTVVVDYILSNGRIEEHKMAEDMNLPFKQIRQSLLELSEHELLTFQEGRRERRHEEASGNMFTRGPDASRMVFWTFNSDIVSVIKCRLFEMKRMLKDVIDQAKHVKFQCPTCAREYLDEEAMPAFMCHTCSNVKLKQKTSNVEEAERTYAAAMEEIKHIDNQLNECDDVSLPSSFFGIYHEPLHEAAMSSRRQTARPGVSTAINSSSLKIDVNIIGESAVQLDDISEVDNSLVKYYRKLERPRKKKKTADEQNAYTSVIVAGKMCSVKSLTVQDQLKMRPDEHQEFFRRCVEKLAYL